MAILTTLDVILGAKTGGFDRGMTRAQSKTKQFSGAVGKAGKSIGGTTASLLGFSGAALSLGAAIAVFRSTAEEMDKIGKTSAKLGIATDKLTSLHHAASQTGVSVDTLNMAIQRMVRRIAEANVGTGEAKGAIEELGLSTETFFNASPDEQFRQVADAMQGVKSQADKVRLSMKLFDSEGVALVNTLALGRSGLDQMEDEARSLGVAVDADMVKSFEKFNDAVDRLAKSLKGGLLPALTETAEIGAGVADALFTSYTGRDPNAAKKRALLRPNTGFLKNEERRINAAKAQDNLDKLIRDSEISRKAGFGPQSGVFAAFQENIEAAKKDVNERRKAAGLRERQFATDGAVPGVGGVVQSVAESLGRAAAVTAKSLLGGGNGVVAAMRDADLQERRKQSEILAKAQGPRALSGVAAIDQARANRDAKTMVDPMVKVQNATLQVAELGNDLLQKVVDILDEKLAGVELARP